MPIVLPSPTRPTLTEPTYLKPPLWKPVLAWVGVVLGALFAVAAIGTAGDGIRQAIGISLMGLAMLVPAGWWVFCERKDRTHAEEDYRLDLEAARAGQTMSGYVSGDALTPLTWDTPLTPFTRRWPVVATVSVALLIASIAIMPTAESTPTAVSSSSITPTLGHNR